MNLPIGTLLQGGKYEIKRFISAGGFGCTYEGVHTMLDTRIAIKEFFVKDFCNRDKQTSHVTIGTQSKVELVQKLCRKFIDEAKAINKMQHNNIIRVFDVFEENGTAYYVMDYVDGQSLHEIVQKRGALPEQEVLKYVEQISDALEYVHSQNRLHLDIKPGNIMVDKLGKVKLIDFGASKQYDEVDGENTSSLLGMTPGYAPIEQMGNTVRTFTPATDLYALGATMYKCLTGNTPPEASLLLDDDEELVRPAHVSSSTWVAVEKAMEPLRKHRPQSVREFLSLLGDGVESPAAPIVPTPIAPAIKDINEETRMVREAEAGKITQQNDVLRFVVNGVSFEMIRVEAGTFTMGATPEMEDPNDDEKPTHQVTLTNGYYIGKAQVTQTLWKAVMGDNPSCFEGDNRPVERVSWDDCKRFISKLNSLTGQDFRLPTEAEWEFAARGGNKSKHYQYSGSNRLNDVAWYDNNSRRETHDVATKQPNELGIYDMSGNVDEWCSDGYGRYSSNAQTNPTGPNSGSYRVVRGGSWYCVARGCRSSDRNRCTPGIRSTDLGLRLALSE